ncbi:MAG: hypothetical protein IKV15_02575 [Bacteroidaceae bacterium]|nr:hypothetical protein [Bacteroidaceae bacterium]
MNYNIFYNNNVLSEQERIEFCHMIDEDIRSYSESIDGMRKIATSITSSKSGGFNQFMNNLIDISIFTSYSFCDILVLTKSFILSTNSYEMSFFRGKLKVQLNESFKRIYGFAEKTIPASYFGKLGYFVEMSPNLKSEYDSISHQLDAISKQHTWWKEQRDAEVHIYVDMLYETRHEEINKSKVLMETLPLIVIFDSIHCLMQRMIDFIRSQVPLITNNVL